MRFPFLPLAVAGTLVLSAPAAHAQLPLYAVGGSAPQERCGYSLDDAGDVDGDGVRDLVLGCAHNGPAKRAVVASGVDGHVIHSIYSSQPPAFSHFAEAIAGAGDVNADGFDDVIIGDSNAGSLGHGAAYVYSGLDASLLWTFSGSVANGGLGTAVDGAGDVNADGYHDLIVGAPGTTPNRAFVFSGLDGSILYSYSEGGIPFASAVSGAGDVDGDGFDDYAIGHAWFNVAYVYSGRTGHRLYIITAPVVGFGRTLDQAGDVDADGFPDIIAGGSYCSNAGPRGAAVFSGLTGARIHLFQPASATCQYGFALSGVGDVDGDGHDDVAIGDLGTPPNQGRVEIRSGATGEVLQALIGGVNAPSRIGVSVCGLKSPGSQGRAEYALGAPWAGSIEQGAVQAYAAFLTERYCGPSVPNSSGASARIEIAGSAIVGLNDLTVIASGLPPGRFGYFLVGSDRGLSMPFGSAGLLCLAGSIARLNGAQQIFAGPVGSTSVDLGALPLSPPHVVQPGETWNFQAWFRDVPQTSNFTDAVAVTFS